MRVSLRGDVLALVGSQAAVDRAAPVAQAMVDLARMGETIGVQDVERLVTDGEQGTLAEATAGELKIILPGLRRVIQPKTGGQREYLRAIAEHDIVIGVGPAGTGKTYLAVAAAVDALARKRVRRIVLARPAVIPRSSPHLPEAQSLVQPAGDGVRFANFQVHGGDAELRERGERPHGEVMPDAVVAVGRGDGEVQDLTLVGRAASHHVTGDLGTARRDKKRGAPFERLPEVAQRPGVREADLLDGADRREVSGLSRTNRARGVRGGPPT